MMLKQVKLENMITEQQILDVIKSRSRLIETDNWTYNAVDSEDFPKLAQDIVKLLPMRCVNVVKRTVCGMKGKGFCPYELKGGYCKAPVGDCLNQQTER